MEEEEGCLPLPWRDEDSREVARDDETVRTDESSASGAYAFLAVGGEWDVGDAGVATVERPLGLAVANQEHSWRWWTHGNSVSN